MQKQKFAGRSILIVEPDPFIAVDLQDTFADEGARVVTAFRLERALQLAERPTLSAAVIDSALGTEDRGALCCRLAERKVPFVFHSERKTCELGEWADVPLITKPADGEKLVEVVASLLGAGAAAPGESRQTQLGPPDHSRHRAPFSIQRTSYGRKTFG
jgi:DNA-binding response OmpR family regulator